MKKKTLNFNKSTVAQLNNVEQNNINGAAMTQYHCQNSNPAYVTCPVICYYTDMCSEHICISERPCYTNDYMAC
ncbi:MAG: class I lanthipeptide [Hyphomicrobiales bacterium]